MSPFAVTVGSLSLILWICTPALAQYHGLSLLGFCLESKEAHLDLPLPVLTRSKHFGFLRQGQTSPAGDQGDRKRQTDEPVSIVYSQPVKPTFPDLLLRNQHGQKVRFHTDLIKGKVVVLTFFYSTCQYVCDIQASVLSKLQSRLGNRLGKEVFLISVTRDPATDTPRRLKAWSKKFKVKPGWTLVTGEVDKISKLLKMFVGDGPGRPEMHSADFLIGNDKAQKWVATPGIGDPEALFRVIESIARDDL